jgi:transcription elongation factor GreA-like protein
VKEALDGLNHQKSNLTNRDAWEQLARLRDMEKFLENLQSVYDSVHAKTRFVYKEQIYLVRNGSEDSVSAVKVLKQMGIRLRHHHFN